MTKVTAWLLVGLLLTYFVFTSGLFYWASGCEETTKLITPFSWALSAKERGFTGVATEADMDCVHWLVDESKQELEIACDSNAQYLLSGYTELLSETWELLDCHDRIIIMSLMAKRERCYIFFTEWNMEYGMHISTSDIGLRRQNPYTVQDLGEGNVLVTCQIYNLDEPWITFNKEAIAREVYRSGNAVVYEKGQWPR